MAKETMCEALRRIEVAISAASEARDLVASELPNYNLPLEFVRDDLTGALDSLQGATDALREMVDAVAP